MKTLTLFLLAGCFWAHAHGAITIEPPRQHADIYCTESVSLKDLFDAGLRPYRESDDACGVGKSTIGLAVPPSAQKIQTDVEMASFAISRHDTVKRIDIRTTAAPVKQTGDLLRQLAVALGVGLQGLDEALARATPSNPKWSDVWTQDWANDWLAIRLGFQPLTYFLDDASKAYREIKSHAILTIEWKPAEIGPTYREKPISPPNGYEHVSMEMPGSNLVKTAQISNDPALAHLRYPDETQRQAILATTPDPVPKSRTTQPSAKKKVASSAPASTANEGPASSTPWSIIVVSIVAATGLLWLVLKRQTK